MSTVVIHRTIKLRHVGGTSDKTYIATIVEDSNGRFSTECRYGRTGSENTPVTKAKDVTYGEAERAFNKIVSEKKNSRTPYLVVSESNPGRNGAVTQGAPTPTQRVVVASHPPQLLNVVDEVDVPGLLASGDWAVEEKMDGNRVQAGVIIDTTGKLSAVGYNRKGQVVHLPATVCDVLGKLTPSKGPIGYSTAYLLDGELIGEYFHIFDFLVADGEDISQLAYTVRRMRLEAELQQIMIGQVHVKIVPLLPETMATIADLRVKNAEGAVLKKKDSLYSAGRPNSGGPCLKLKFTEMSSCIVTKVNVQRSVQIGLLTEVYSWADEPTMLDVGNVTVPANMDIPKIGAIIEVRYLYMFKNGSLFQPVLHALRDDIDKEECTIGQVKRFKATTSTAADPE